MRGRAFRLGVVAAAMVVSAAAVPAAWGHDGEEHPAPPRSGSSSSSGSGDHSDDAPKPVNYQIVQGDFFPMAGHEAVFGSAKLGVASAESKLWVHVGGLDPKGKYASHLHEGSCGAPGGHYRNKAKGEAAPPNELWASTDPADPAAGVTADDSGGAAAEGTAAWKARKTARAVMLHGPGGEMLACADLT